MQRELDERKRADELLASQDGILTSILNSIGDGLIVVDERGKISMLNRAAAQILGIDSADIASFDWATAYTVYLPDAVTPCAVEQRPLSRAMRGEHVGSTELFIRSRKSSEGMWVHVTAHPLQDKQGVIRGGAAVFRDITAQKHAEEARAAERNLLRTVIDNLPSPIFVKDAQSRFVLVNTTLARLLGASDPEQIAGKTDRLFPKGVGRPISSRRPNDHPIR